MRGSLDLGWRRCICVASGPSLAYGDQKERIRAAARDGWRILVANATFRDFPDADLLFGVELKFWQHYAAEVAASFRGERWTGQDDAAKRYGISYIEVKRLLDSATGLVGGLSRDPRYICHGGNSGHALPSMAYHRGAEVILLSGFDMQHTGGAINADGVLVGGPIHHHGEHPRPLSNPQPSALAGWAERFRVIARELAADGITLVNCTVETAITCVPRMTLADALERYTERAAA